MRATDEALRRWALAAFALVVAAIAGDVLLARGLADQPVLTYAWQADTDQVVGKLATASVGLWVTWARPANPIGWLITASAAALAVCDVLQTYGARSFVFPDEGLPLGTAALSLGAPLWVAAVAIPVTFLLVRYPSGRVAGRWGRRFDRLALAALVPLLVGYALAEPSVTDVVRGEEPPWNAPAWLANGLAASGALALLTATALIVAHALWRVFRAERQERAALLLLLLTAVVATLTIFFGPSESLGTVSYSLILVAVAIGVVRFRALGVEVVLRRALVYTVLTGLVLLVFAAVVAASTRLSAGGGLPELAAAVLVAIGLVPARDHVQRFIDRILYGERDDPWSALGRLRRPGTEESLVPAVLAALAGGLHLSSGRILAEDGRVLAAWPRDVVPDAGQEVELSLGGSRVGTLVLGPRRGESVLGEADLRLLDAVAPLIAAVLQAERLAGEVRAQQARVVEATLSERARLRHDLHDGLGPSLTGIGLGLEALATRGADPDLVDRLRCEVAASLEETRRIIDDLRPTALDADDLAGALRTRAAQVAAAVEVHLDIPARLPGLSPEVEKAAFRIVDEALTNVVRHARARRCTVTVTAGTELVLTVSDDGTGALRRREGGVGLGSMEQRAEQLGGSLQVRRLTPGTEVRAVLPSTCTVPFEAAR